MVVRGDSGESVASNDGGHFEVVVELQAQIRAYVDDDPNVLS